MEHEIVSRKLSSWKREASAVAVYGVECHALARRGLQRALSQALDGAQRAVYDPVSHRTSLYTFKGGGVSRQEGKGDQLMVKKQLDDFLSGQGVEEVAAEGKMFDPAVHEAVSQEDCEASPEGSVLRVIRRGFQMGERLLRPANVVVSRTPQSEEPSEEMEEES